MKCEKKSNELKQLGIFLVICLPVTWGLMTIGYRGILPDGNMEPWANVLLNIACFMPAIAAVIACLISKEKLCSLQFLPKFQGHGKVYLSAVLLGIILSCADLLLLAVIFPKRFYFTEEATLGVVVFNLLFAVAMSVVSFFVSMGEELGWMGYLYPRMEKVCGTTAALLLTGIIRSSWHMVMLLQQENPLGGFLSLTVSNILLGSVLVWVTKASRSVIPASMLHAMTNGVPSAWMASMVLDDSIFNNDFGMEKLVQLLPAIVIGGGCYLALRKNRTKSKE